MDRSARPVKTPRRYDASARRESARASRARVIDVARGLFLRDGYAATTMAGVARAAAVSPETIYKAFGGKPGLVRAIQEQALAGIGPVAAPDRSDAMSRAERDPLTIVRNWATLVTEVAPLVSPILLLVRAAATTDEDMAALLQELHAQREQRMAHNARRLARRGGLRPGVTIKRARDVMLAYTSPELYELLVLKQGWTPSQFGDFVQRGLAAELLPD